MRFNERLRIDGEALAEAAWCEAFAAVEVARGAALLTAFEFETLAALWLLARHSPQLLLLEVGLGGRLDAVGVVAPQLVLISSVALDHERWLGDNREAIGAEKAALFTTNCPVVYGDPDPPHSVRQLARQRAVRWHGLGQQYRHDAAAGGRWRWRGIDSAERALRGSAPGAPLLDADSVAAALQAWFLLRPRLCPAGAVDVATAVAVAASTRLAGRRQCLRRGGVRHLLDVAHNPAAAAHLAGTARAVGGGAPVVVFGMMADKDCGGFIEALRGSVGAWCVAELPTPRAAPATALAALLRRRDAIAHCCGSVADALARAATLAGADGTVLVTGSFAIVAEALRQLGGASAVPGS